MQNYLVRLESAVAESFRCQKAANSLDIDVAKKSVHNLSVNADLKTPFNVGLIVGASGSGKTTLARQIWGADCFKEFLDPAQPVIDQLPKAWKYDDCASVLSGVGLTSVPCWIRPAYTLSNGQRARAEAALLMANLQDDGTTVIDEWTSVVDRTVAKAMSHCIQKHARKQTKRVVLLSCHYDVIEWLNPDWVIDCNRQEYIDRRNMVGSAERTDRLRFDVREVGRETWPYFSKYHYLSDRLPGGKIYTFGLFNGKDQVGFECFAAYMPGDMITFFSNRAVIHPDYSGLGLGIKMIDECSKEMVRRGFRIKAKFSSIPLHKARAKNPLWRLTDIQTRMNSKNFGAGFKSREAAFRKKVRTFHYDFVWKEDRPSMGGRGGELFESQDPAEIGCDDLGIDPHRGWNQSNLSDDPS